MGLYEVGRGPAHGTDQGGGEVVGAAELLAELRALEDLGLVRRMPATTGEPRFAITHTGRHAARLEPRRAAPGAS